MTISVVAMEDSVGPLERRSESGLSWSYLPVTLERDSLTRVFRTHLLPVVRPAWKDFAVQTKIFTEGITNVLVGFYVSRDGKADMVLLRMNGEGTDSFVDRRTEILVMLSLHKAGLVPPLYLEVANGLCYGYIPGRPFTVDDMQKGRLLEASNLDTQYVKREQLMKLDSGRAHDAANCWYCCASPCGTGSELPPGLPATVVVEDQTVLGHCRWKILHRPSQNREV
jgi:hypothetical protein